MPELLIYDDIGPAWAGMVNAASVIEELKPHVGNEVTVRINSGGGDVFEARAIYNALTRHAGGVVVEIDGLAASAASYIAMAGNKIRIAENAQLMIHQAWTFAWGNKTELAKTVSLLDDVDKNILDTYSARVGDKSERAQIEEWLIAETWMDAKAAVERGFADEIGQKNQVSPAQVPSNRFRRAPAALVGKDADLAAERKWRREQAALGRKIHLTRLRRPA